MTESRFVESDGHCSQIGESIAVAINSAGVTDRRLKPPETNANQMWANIPQLQTAMNI